MSEIPIEAGQRAFGADAANYDSARPEYPAEVYALLRSRCGLMQGTRTFEVGPGTGLATRRLVENGAAPLFAVEPDERLAAKLKERSPQVIIVGATFEEAALGEGTFDLGVAATSFHWMDQRVALAKVASLLRSGGWWAMWWNVFGDPERADPFHDATLDLLKGMQSSPSWNPNWKHPFALDQSARIADLEAVGSFENIDVEFFRWTLVLNPAEVRALYATYSQFAALEVAERDRLLSALAQIATEQFAGRVERNMVTATYTARRR